MLYTVSFDRLSLLSDGKELNGKRVYDIRVIATADLEKIQTCIKYGLGLAV